MKRGTRRFTFETIRSGQPRPYADSVEEVIVTVEWIDKEGGEFVPNGDLDSVVVTQVVRGFMSFIERNEVKHGFEKILSSRSYCGNGQWRFIATTAFSD